MSMTQERPEPGFHGGGGPVDMGFGPGPGPGPMTQMMGPDSWIGGMPPPGGPSNFSNSMLPSYGGPMPPMMPGSMMGPGGQGPGVPGPGGPGMMPFEDMLPPMGPPMHHQPMMPASPGLGHPMPPSPMGVVSGSHMPLSPMGMPMVSNSGPSGGHPSPGPPPSSVAPLHHMQQMIPPVPGSSMPNNSMQPSSPMPQQNPQMTSGSMQPHPSSHMQSPGPMPPPNYTISGPMNSMHSHPQGFNGMRPSSIMNPMNAMAQRGPFDMPGMMRPGPPHPMGPQGPMGPPHGPPNHILGAKVYPPNQPMVFNHANPNAPPIYPCGTCHKEVHDNDQAVLCESGCNFWFHRPCSGLTEAAFFYLTKDVYAEWVCDKCLTQKDIPLVKLKP